MRRARLQNGTLTDWKPRYPRPGHAWVFGLGSKSSSLPCAKRRHTFESGFDVSRLTELPRVDIVYGYEGADGLLVRALIDAKVPGIVLAGMAAGAWGMNLQTLAEARRNGAIVVVTSRTGSGRVIRTARHVEDEFVAADNLSPQKARILLQLALTATKDVERIQQMFELYYTLCFYRFQPGCQAIALPGLSKSRCWQNHPPDSN